MPSWRSSASRLTSATTSGTLGSIRQALELSTTTQPASVNLGAHSRETPPPAEKSAMSKPSIASSAQRAHLELAVAEGHRLPGGALGGERHDLATRRSARSLITSSMVEPTAPVAPTTATRARSSRPTVLALDLVLAELEASCSARTASGTRSAAITQEILIGDVEIISMLISSRRGSRTPSRRRRGGCACPRHDRDLAHLVVRDHRVEAELAGQRLERAPRDVRVRLRHGEGDLGAAVGRHGLVLDDHVDVHVGLPPARRRCAPRCPAGPARR